MRNPFIWDKVNGILMFKDLLAFNWCRRNGNAFIIERGCQYMLSHPACPHMQDIYVHVFNYGGWIAWKSHKCYNA